MYQTLYNARQREAAFLPLEWYYEDALSLPWVRSISIQKVPGLDRRHSRGFVFPEDMIMHGGLVTFAYRILIAEGLTADYERFVTIKELMHCYFPPLPNFAKYITGSQIALEAHMRSFFGQGSGRPEQARAEYMARWMALGVVCTEQERGRYLESLTKNELDVQAMLRELRIPAHLAGQLLTRQYLVELEKLLSHE